MHIHVRTYWQMWELADCCWTAAGEGNLSHIPASRKSSDDGTCLTLIQPTLKIIRMRVAIDFVSYVIMIDNNYYCCSLIVRNAYCILLFHSSRYASGSLTLNLQVDGEYIVAWNQCSVIALLICICLYKLRWPRRDLPQRYGQWCMARVVFSGRSTKG